MAEQKRELWAVADDGDNWLIVEIPSGRTKIIGRVGAKRANYYDKAVLEAVRRNRKFGVDGYIFISEPYVKGMNLRRFLGSTIRKDR
jgi:hypothetical protein